MIAERWLERKQVSTSRAERMAMRLRAVCGWVLARLPYFLDIEVAFAAHSNRTVFNGFELLIRAPRPDVCHEFYESPLPVNDDGKPGDATWRICLDQIRKSENKRAKLGSLGE